MSRAFPDARYCFLRIAVPWALWLLIPAANSLLAFEPLWVVQYPGRGSAAALAVDRLGNTSVTGGGMYNGDSAVTVMYDRDGQQVWAAGARLGSRCPRWVAVGLDHMSNLYVAGWVDEETMGVNARSDYVVIKYRPTGEQAWVARYNHNAVLFGTDDAYAAFVDSAGNVYVTGCSYDDSTGRDCATVKFDSSGARQWVARWDGGGGRSEVDFGGAITSDRQGNVYVAGITDAGAGTYFLTLKYSPAGDLLWAGIDSAPAALGEIDIDVAVDRTGNVYSFSTSEPGLWNYDYYLLKYDNTGQRLWARAYDNGGDDVGRAMVLDDSAGVYVTGRSEGPGAIGNICTVKYDSAGNELWVARHGHIWGGAGFALATDGKYVYTAGSCGDSTVTCMCFVTCDAVSGAILWAAPFRYPANVIAAGATAVAIGPDNCVHAAGWCWRADTSQPMTCMTLKYNASGAGVSLEPAANVRFQLQVVPSPFSGRAAIRYQTLMPGWVRITAVDVTGRTVATLFDGAAAAGREEVTWLPTGIANGVYFIKLETLVGKVTERALLVR